ncbi:MAG TPA: hypothetical protein VK190_03260 [Pseudoneobacillus sp.]|jgi:hypothetical protein|nr:hypothetical protein [Pseudoneobacillus sp.]
MSISKFLEYRPELQYVYKEIVTKAQELQGGNYIFLHSGSLASDTAENIANMNVKLNDLIEEAKKEAGPLYDEYKKAQDLPYSHDKYKTLETLEKKMADVDGNPALEALPILEDIKADWKKYDDLYNKTVVALMNEEFPEGDMKDKEIQLDSLIKQLHEDKNKSDMVLTELYCGDLTSPKIEEEKKNNDSINRLLEEANNLSYGKSDLCNTLDIRCYDTLELLYSIDSMIHSTPQEKLDKQLVDVLQYILASTNPYETTFVISYLKQLQSLLRLTLDGKINNQFATRDKMRITSNPSFKTYLSNNLKNTFLYRHKISTKTMYTLEGIPAGAINALDKVVDTIVDGLRDSESKYVSQMVDFDKITKTDVVYKTALWAHIEDKELVRVLYKVILSLIDFISKTNSIPEKKDLYDWLINFCQVYKLNVYFDKGQNKEVTLF